MIRLGLLAAGGENLVEAAQPVMEELAADTGETVVLSVPSEHQAVDVAQVDSRYLLGGQSWVGRRLPLHATSDGKVLLAWEAATLEADARLERVTPETITSRRKLERDLAGSRANGFARAIGECEPRLNGVAAPIFGAHGRCVAALSVSGPDYRLSTKRLGETGARCRAAADEVSRRLGSIANGDRP
jgi:DNA-binding IclR family transcriptional regulator